ncbi:MAG: hypothetical protein V7731_20575 [Amphritea sp.]
MSHITVRAASENELENCQSWDLWESGNTDTFEYSYDQDVQFIVQSGEAVIRSQFEDCVSIYPGCHVLIRKGMEGKWDITAPVSNRYTYL